MAAYEYNDFPGDLRTRQWIRSVPENLYSDVFHSHSPEHEIQLPALSRTARNVLCIMANNATNARNLSLPGQLVSSKTSLKLSCVDDILFINPSLNATRKDKEK